MSDLLGIILLTYQRTAYAVQTIHAVARHLRTHRRIVWYVADDGSDPAHLHAIEDAIRTADQTIAGQHSQRQGYGANANRAWQWARAVTDVTLWLEDDWVLASEFSLDRHIDVLDQHQDIGMIRFGYLQYGISGWLDGRNNTLYWCLDRIPHVDGTPVFTGHPSLRHQRYADAYGPYPVGLAPGATELAYAAAFRYAAQGPAILYPAELTCWGAWGHIGAEQA